MAIASVIEELVLNAMKEATKHIKIYVNLVYCWCSYIICDATMSKREMSFRIVYDRLITVLNFGKKYASCKSKAELSYKFIMQTHNNSCMYI